MHKKKFKSSNRIPTPEELENFQNPKTEKKNKECQDEIKRRRATIDRILNPR